MKIIPRAAKKRGRFNARNAEGTRSAVAWKKVGRGAKRSV